MIRLINRRFVPFYFNVGRGQPGFDSAASDVIVGLDERFAGRSVPTPPVWILSPDLELVATINNYLPKESFFAELVRVMNEHPDYAQPNADEREATGLAAARLREEVGDYDAAMARYSKIDERAAVLARARIARYQEDWETAEILLSDLADFPQLADEVAMETAHRLLAEERFDDARSMLLDAIRAHPKSRRLGEMHFYAGVACFRLDERGWANFHWCWVLRNLPDDNQYMRCYLAATADAMPYPNPELDGYRSKSRMISHDLADRCRAKAMEDYERLLPHFEAEQDGG